MANHEHKFLTENLFDICTEGCGLTRLAVQSAKKPLKETTPLAVQPDRITENQPAESTVRDFSERTDFQQE